VTAHTSVRPEDPALADGAATAGLDLGYETSKDYCARSRQGQTTWPQRLRNDWIPFRSSNSHVKPGGGMARLPKELSMGPAPCQRLISNGATIARGTEIHGAGWRR
jgi:hypothetical protein